MKVLYILNSTNPMGGATKSFLAMLRGLKDKGVTPYVVVPDHGGVTETLNKEGITTLVLNYRMTLYPDFARAKDKLLFLPRLLMRLLINYRAALLISRYIHQNHIQLVHTNVSVVNIGLKGSKQWQIPHIFHIREYGDTDFHLKYYPSRNQYLKQLTGQGIYTICITKDIQCHYHLDGDVSSCVIYNGVSHTISQRPNNDEGRFFLYAGRLEPAKGVDRLLHAYDQYQKATTVVYPLYIAGGGDDSNYIALLHQYVSEHRLESLVKFLGNRTDMNHLYRQAKAVVVPSPHEGFGRVMAEAMFANCLVICKNSDGSKEQMENGMVITGNKIAIEYTALEELAQALCHVAQTKDNDFDKMKADAFTTVNKLYTSEKNTDDVYDFYCKIITHERNH